MPFPRAHRMLTLFGDAYNESEIWQVGMRLDQPPTDDVGEGALEDVLEAATTWFEQGDGFSQHVRLLGAKVAPVQLDGKYGDGNDAQLLLLDTPVDGTSGSNFLVPQSSMVLTLMTSLSRGRGSKGRIYPPTQAIELDASGRALPAVAGRILDAGRVLIEAINAVNIGAVSVGSALGAGSLRAVEGVRIGRVVDTQRRRRNQIAEEYVSVPLG